MVADTRGPRLPVTPRAELSRDRVESDMSIDSNNDSSMGEWLVTLEILLSLVYNQPTAEGSWGGDNSV